MLDFNSDTFKLSDKEIDLSGLVTPVKLTLTFGAFSVDTIIDDDFFTKKGIPLCLLTGLEDALTITKKPKVSDTSLNVSGEIAREDITHDLTADRVIISWGDNFTEVIPAGSFVQKKLDKNVFTYKKARDAPGAVTAVTLDFDKCKFKIQIKNAAVTLASTGTVTLSVAAQDSQTNTFVASDDYTFE
jgi:hypothetical protein